MVFDLKPSQTMKKHFVTIALLTSVTASAYVPNSEQWFGQGGPVPAVRPVHGPIRPNAASVISESETGSALLPHRPTGDLYYLASPIFWGKEWSDRKFESDKVDGIDRWYGGYTQSNYARMLHGGIGFRGSVIDSNAGPGRGPQNGDLPLAVKEICGLIKERKVPYLGLGSFYPIYLTKKRPAGGACGINVTDWCTGMNTPISFALIYNLDGDKYCDPYDTETHHSQGLSAIANVTARAVADLLTDWDFNGLFDTAGNEVDDKCAWTFNVPYVTFTNGSTWKLQGMWSDEAYAAGTGYPNAGGARGCLDGH